MLLSAAGVCSLLSRGFVLRLLVVPTLLTTEGRILTDLGMICQDVVELLTAYAASHHCDHLLPSLYTVAFAATSGVSLYNCSTVIPCRLHIAAMCASTSAMCSGVDLCLRCLMFIVTSPCSQSLQLVWATPNQDADTTLYRDARGGTST
jgi:hypothetical protein